MAKTVQTEAQDTVDLMFRAFSDRTRLRILHVLRGGELCVGDIVESLRAPQPRISRHLAYLRKAKLVVVRKSGLWSHYSLAPAKTPFHRKLLECLAKCFGEVPELQADECPRRQDQKIRRLLSINLTLHLSACRKHTTGQRGGHLGETLFRRREKMDRRSACSPRPRAGEGYAWNLSAPKARHKMPGLKPLGRKRP